MMTFPPHLHRNTNSKQHPPPTAAHRASPQSRPLLQLWPLPHLGAKGAFPTMSALPSWLGTLNYFGHLQVKGFTSIITYDTPLPHHSINIEVTFPPWISQQSSLASPEQLEQLSIPRRPHQCTNNSDICHIACFYAKESTKHGARWRTVIATVLMTSNIIILSIEYFSIIIVPVIITMIIRIVGTSVL